MNILQRIWAAVFGPYTYMNLDKTELLIQRGHYGQLLISAQDDCYAIQIRLSGDQARELTQWLAKTNYSINPPRQNKVIRFPTNKLKKY